MQKLLFDQNDKLFYCYLDTSVSFIGEILCIISLIIFFNSKFKENFYNYIRIELIFTCLILFIYILRSCYYCKDTRLGTYTINIMHIFNRFARNTFELSAIIVSILSTIEFYLLLINQHKSKYNLLSRISYIINALLVLILSSLIFSYRLFETDILKFKYNNVTFGNKSDLYYISNSKFSNSYLFRINNVASFLLLGGISGIVLLILNIVIFVKVKQILHKKQIVQGATAINTQRKSSLNIENTKRSMILMVFVGSANTIIGNMPQLVFYIFEVFKIKMNNDFFKYSSLAAHTFLALSFTIKFILYYWTNNLFRNTFHDYFRILFHI